MSRKYKFSNKEGIGYELQGRTSGIVGITSVMDENGKTTYYDYDNFSRIQLIKDNDRNIIQAYRYNYKTNP